MKRKYIPIERIQIYDEMHKLQPDGSFIVDEAKDGKSTEDHSEGIEYIKSVLRKGKKIMPVLVFDSGEGIFIRLDGFKRCIAQKELGYKNIEAFVCDIGEYEYRKRIPFLKGEMHCYKGGQPKEIYPSLFEGNQNGKEFDYGDIEFLYKSENPDGLRIELDENIHVHWGEFGKNRLTLGKKDFITLAEAISKI